MFIYVLVVSQETETGESYADMESMKDKLLEVASELVQKRGYNDFSYADLAGIIGIKTASIHYHFPSKADLGRSLAQRYTKKFMTTLGDPKLPSLKNALEKYIVTFKNSLRSGRMCLCGMIGAEIESVPSEIAEEIKRFFQENEVWLISVLTHDGIPLKTASKLAKTLIAALEGGMIMARVKQDLKVFDDVAEVMLNNLLRRD